ncbi:hypothetical protein [Reticulibacter mediterranei]|uniref:hypothetical protein n=1 Tax=Reticulibacter mediterranei TaxID=2778369 RepID=UPI001C691089|nr:hypothetical protein [Reticulibacter mediterranei]
MTGLLTDLPHKTCDTIADVLAGTSLERLPHPLKLDEARVKQLLELHPVSDGLLVLDDTGLPQERNRLGRSRCTILRNTQQNRQLEGW